MIPEGGFRAGAAITDITPPLEVGILMSALERRWAPFTGVRRPLCARAVVFDSGTQRVALVSLDLLGLSGEAFEDMAGFKRRVVAAANRVVQVEDLILVATHTHTAPESLAITGLYRTPAFKAWIAGLARQIGAAIQQAGQALQPCRVAAGCQRVPGLAIYRRIKTTGGIVLSHPPPPPEQVISREGPVDEMVNLVACLDASEKPLAILVNAACHPVHEMCLPQLSPDYPGEMSLLLEQEYPGSTALFLNGAAGNINPPTVSGGAGEAERHGRRLAQAAAALLEKLQPVPGREMILLRRPLKLPARDSQGRSLARPLVTGIAALRLGQVVFLFFPGELFVEIGLAIQANAPGPFTFVVGYAEDYIGYIPTDRAFEEGGYELGPGPWARVGPGSEAMLYREATTLLYQVLGYQSQK